LTGNEVINGDLYIKGSRLNLAGRTLKVNGNLIQTEGTLDVNGGRLEVTGNYTISGYSYLNMTKDEDYILVRGNFETRSVYDHQYNLTAGTLEVKGNFTQICGVSKNFNASGTHKVILSGNEVQNIYFSSIPSSTINNLIITKPLSEGYTYNALTGYDSISNKYYYIPPWKNLIEQFDPNPQPGTTISKASLAPARKGLGLAEVNAKLYAFGGCYPDPKNRDNTIYLDTVSEYDPVKNIWTEYSPGSSPNPNKKMRVPKSDMAVAATDNRIYVIGGFNGVNYLNTVEVYNPSIGEFDNSVAFPAISEAKSGAGAVVIGDKLYVIGGYNDSKYSDTKGKQPTNKNEVERTVIDKRGKISKEIYNINFAGKPLKTIDAKGRETTYKYEIKHDSGIIDITNFTYNDLKKSPAYHDIRNKNLPEIVSTTFNGSTTKAEKDEKGNVVMITYPDNSTKKYSYYENGDLMYEIDQMNRQTFYMYENYESYQENGVTKYRSRLTRIVKPVESGVVYTSTNLPTDGVLKAGDAVTCYEYVTGYNKIKGCLIQKIIYPNGTWITYKYSDNGNLLATSDKIDLTVSNNIDAAYQYEYDDCFRVSLVTTPLGFVTEYRYNNTNQTTHVIKKDLDGKAVSIHRTYYDYDGRKKKEVNPVMYNSTYDTGKDYIGTASKVYEYDVYGRVTKVIENVQGSGLSSTITKYEYDAEGNLIGKKNYSKAAAGANEVLVSYYIYEYDSLNRLEATYFKDNDNPDTRAVKLEEYIYEDIYGESIKKSKKIYRQYLNDGKFAKTEYIYDYAGREVEVIHPDEAKVIKTVTTYYPDGNVMTVKDPRGSISYYTYRNYDSNRNLYYDEKYVPVEKLNNNTYEISYSRVNYDKAGRKVEEISYTDLIAATLSSDGTYSFAPNALDGKKHNIIAYSYYNDNSLKQESSSNGKKVEYFYDNGGNLIEERTTFDKDVYGNDRKKSVLYLDYNAHGKPEKTVVLVKNEDISRDMQLNGDNVVPFERLFPVNDQGVTDYGPYEYHRDCSAIVTTYGDFDAQGNAGKIVYPNNFVEKFSYDSLGRVIKKSVTIRDMENPETTERYKTVDTITTYNWEGKIARVEILSKYEGIVDNLGSTTYEYDGRGFMTKTTTDVTFNKYDEVNKTVKQEKESVTVAYEYDTAGRLIAEVSAQNYIQGKKPSQTGNYVKYMYYDSGRLKTKSFEGITKKYNPTTKSFEDVASSIVIEAYAYDENGNVTKKWTVKHIIKQEVQLKMLMV